MKQNETVLTGGKNAEAIQSDIPAGYRFLISQFPQPALLVSDLKTGGILYANPAFLAMTGFKEPELLLHPTDTAIAFEWNAETADVNSIDLTIPVRAFARLNVKDGNSQSCNATIHRLPAANLNQVLLVSIESEDQEILQNRIDFISMVSHELKTPVTTAKGYAQLLMAMLQENRSLSPDLLQESLSRIHYQIDRIALLVRSLLESAHLEHGSPGLADETVALDKLLAEVIRYLRFVNPGRELKLQAEEGIMVKADRNRIEQVLINLVNNALKFSADDRPVDIRLAADRCTREATLEVEDRGIGIEVSEQQKIFQRFYRSPGRGLRGEKGFGLGLYLVKQLISRLEGSIQVHSVLGKGSCFIIRLPLAD